MILLHHKSKVIIKFKHFVEKSKAHLSLRVANLYCDIGGKYVSNDMKEYCNSKGISYHLKTPHTPQLNGITERMMRTIVGMARTFLWDSWLSKGFRDDAVLTATYLINRTQTFALPGEDRTPSDIWHGEKAKVKILRIFAINKNRHLYTLRNECKTEDERGEIVIKLFTSMKLDIYRQNVYLKNNIN